jgi:hypothetical protein
VFCDEISTCFSDPLFNNGEVVGGEELWGWSILIKDFFDDNSDAELECGIYVAGDSGTCSASSGVQVGTVLIKKDSVAFLLNTGSKASSFQLYAGKCEGVHLLNDVDGSCNSFDVQDNARSPVSYPLSATLDSSATNFMFSADNQQDYTKTYTWGKILSSTSSDRIIFLSMLTFALPLQLVHIRLPIQDLVGLGKIEL